MILPSAFRLALQNNGAFSEAVLENGVSARNPVGDTPLHVACYWGDAKAVEALVAQQADVSAVGEFGNTPLHCAAEIGHIAIAALLIAAGADRCAINHFGETPDQIAADKGYGELCQLLARNA